MPQRTSPPPGRSALITGASGGIGLELARLLARDGHDLVLVARSEGALREVASDLSASHHVRAAVIAADLSVPGSAADVVARLSAGYGAGDPEPITVDILVNNAGVGLAGRFAEHDLGDELSMLQLNVAAPMALTRLLVPGMLRRRFGRVLNVASTAAFLPGPYMAGYYASKAYLLSFSQAIAEELDGTGVTVTTLCPGPTRTGFAAAAHADGTRLFRSLTVMDAPAVARIGYAGMQRGRRVVVAGLANRLLIESARLAPRALLVWLARRLNEPGQ